MSNLGAPMDQLNQVLLKGDIRVGADLGAWMARGGGEGLANALRDPSAIIRTIEESDLRANLFIIPPA